MQRGTAIASVSVVSILAGAACGASPKPAPTGAATAAAPGGGSAVANNAAGAVGAPAAAPWTGEIALPGAPAGGVFIDYIAYDRAHHRVWIPAGAAQVAVIDTADGAVHAVTGFPTKEMERHGQKRTVGPSSVTVGDAAVFVGNRGDSSICAFDGATLEKQGCVTLAGMPDGIAYVAATRQVWVTTPRDKAMHVLDVANPAAPVDVGTITTDGEPEGFAVDDARGVFFTNLEDADKTLAFDLETHALLHTWEPHCGEDGPKGLALDAADDVLFVACPDHVIALDAAHDGALLSKVDTGAGVDAIDYVASRRQLFVAAREAAKLTVIAVDARGQMSVASSVATADGGRNAVATDEGAVYVPIGPSAKVMVVPAGK